MSTPTAGERFGILGRRTIRRAPPGQNATGSYVGLWDIQSKPGSTLHRLEQTYVAALNGVDQIENRKAEAARSGKFTTEGLKVDALAFAAQQLSPVFQRGKHAVAAAKREATELRSKIKPQPVDKTDLVSAMLRAEMRDWLRSKPRAERDAYIAQNAETLDPEMAMAFTELPAAVSGISTVQRDSLIERALQAQHGEALKEVQELERGIEIAERAVQLGREAIIQDAEVDPNEFNQLAAPYEAKAVVPWLRKYPGDKIVVVDLGRGVGRQPTDEEMATGAYFKDIEEYRMANGLPADDNNRSAA
jgi:hypothetical protein